MLRTLRWLREMYRAASATVNNLGASVAFNFATTASANMLAKFTSNSIALWSTSNALSSDAALVASLWGPLVKTQ
jgi:hypothetical protein